MIGTGVRRCLGFHVFILQTNIFPDRCGLVVEVHSRRLLEVRAGCPKRYQYFF
jgi:hypothetical protein